MSSPSILETGQRILSQQPEDSLQAGVTQDGAQVGLHKTLGRGWSLFAWVQYLWDRTKSYGAGLTKRF